MAIHTWIIGASTGIGEALALELAGRGEILCLSARNEVALEALRIRLSGKGHVTKAVDVLDAPGLLSTAQALYGLWGRIDRIIVMAAVYQPMKLGELDLTETQKIIQINLMGMFNAVEAALSVMKAQTGGQITLCASVAGYRGLPNAQPYAATKAGVISLAESLRADWGHKLDIKVINPGFVATRLTEKNDFPMPFVVTPEKAAKAIARGLESKGFEIHFPKRFSYMLKFLRHAPYGLYFRLVGQKPH
jgi:short-subunit dehydrogenase